MAPRAKAASIRVRTKEHKKRRVFPLVLAAVLAYLLLGALLPFLIHPQVSDSFRNAFDPQSFYATGSTDYAALITDNRDALDVRLEMINEAEERIIFSCFDIRESESGKDVFSALLSAAERGVQVQILVDGMNGLVSMSPKPMFWALGRLDNVEIRYYNTPNPLMPWTFNGRLHDKYLIIDHRILLLGGRNTFDKFLGEYVPEEERSHDLDVLIYSPGEPSEGAEGRVLSQVEDYFRGIWASGDVRPHLEQTFPGLGGLADRAAEELRARWDALREGNPGLTAPIWTARGAEMVPIDGAVLISNPTHILSKEPLVWWQMMTLLEGAEHRAYLQTPYAVLSGDMYEGLSQVAAAPNTFSMQLNSIAVGDNVMASSDYYFNRQKVLDTGVELYEYFGDYSSHGKAALVDDDLSLVGSYNLDMRSTYIDTELMLAIHSEAFSEILERHLLEMEASALRVNSDGSYVEKPAVPVKEILPPRKYLYPVTSLLFQPFRFLL